MMPLRHRASIALALSLCIGTPSYAQEARRTQLDVGATLAHVGEPLDGYIGATTLGAAIDAITRARWGAGIGARLMVPIGVTAAIPSCIPGVRCIEYRSPNVLYGVSAYGYRQFADRAVRLSYGAGWMQASGARGDDADDTGTIEVGVHVTPRRANGAVPVFGVSVLRGLRSAGGVQTLVLPSVGLRF